MNLKSKNVLSGVCSGIICLLGSTAPCFAQDHAPGTNDNNVRKPDRPKKENLPNKESKKDGPNIQTVLIFPPDTPKTASVADQLTDAVAEVIRRRLNASGKYHSVYFTPSLATVRRAVIEGTMTTNDTVKPFSSPQSATKVKRISQLVGYPTVFTSEISDYSFDADKHQATLIISLTLVDYSGSKPVARSSSEQMVSSDKEPKTASEVTVALDVARDLTEKLMTELFKPKTTAPTESDAADKADKKTPEKTNPNK